MKKKLLIFLPCLAILLAACTEEPIEPKYNDPDPNETTSESESGTSSSDGTSSSGSTSDSTSSESGDASSGSSSGSSDTSSESGDASSGSSSGSGSGSTSVGGHSESHTYVVPLNTMTTADHVVLDPIPMESGHAVANKGQFTVRFQENTFNYTCEIKDEKLQLSWSLSSSAGAVNWNAVEIVYELPESAGFDSTVAGDYSITMDIYTEVACTAYFNNANHSLQAGLNTITSERANVGVVDTDPNFTLYFAPLDEANLFPTSNSAYISYLAFDYTPNPNAPTDDSSSSGSDAGSSAGGSSSTTDPDDEHAHTESHTYVVDIANSGLYEDDYLEDSGHSHEGAFTYRIQDSLVGSASITNGAVLMSWKPTNPPADTYSWVAVELTYKLPSAYAMDPSIGAAFKVTIDFTVENDCVVLINDNQHTLTAGYNRIATEQSHMGTELDKPDLYIYFAYRDNASTFVDTNTIEVDYLAFDY